MKKVIAEIIHNVLKEKNIKLSQQEIESLIEIPPSTEMGDYAFPCFSLANSLKMPPSEVAVKIRKGMPNQEDDLFSFEDIQTQGPYVNFFINRKALALQLIDRIRKEKENYGKPPSQKVSKKPINTMVEFPSPNTNKPLHLGHLRNMSIGESVSRILEFNGEKVIRANLNNDRGIHICKSMTAYEKFGNKKTPSSQNKKSDHFVGDYYVMFNQKSKISEKLEIESHRMLQKYEKGDKKVLALWKKMNKWALDGFNQTYKRFGIKHDVEFFESDIYKKGREIVMKGVKDKIFEQKKDGAVIINLKKEKLGEKILLRIDGTSVYITQDLYLAKLKFEKYKLDKSIYVVGNEQDYHFNVLFTILKKLGFDSSGLYHLSYGMVELPEGKMKSREGTVVDADDLMDKIQNLVKKELIKRDKLSKTELEKRSSIITLAAIKYILLRVDSKKNMTFNPKESINFEGETGPYILYAYARANSILKKVKINMDKKPIEDLEKPEIDLIKKLEEFSQIFKKSYETLNPSLIANYAYQLAQKFNEFYHSCPVLKSDKKFFRLGLVSSFKQVLKNSLTLLGIETLEVM